MHFVEMMMLLLAKMHVILLPEQVCTWVWVAFIFTWTADCHSFSAIELRPPHTGGLNSIQFTFICIAFFFSLQQMHVSPIYNLE